MENCNSAFIFLIALTLTTLSTASAQLEVFVSEQRMLCPQETATFTCSAAGDLIWDVGVVTDFSIVHTATSDGIRRNGGASAVIISSNGGVRTSVLRFDDTFPSSSFTIVCDQGQPFLVDFAVAPQRPSSVVASYIEAGEFLYFNISFSPPGDGQTNLTYRVQIDGNEVALTEQLWLFTAIVNNRLMVTDLDVTVTAINECGQESPSSLPVQAERVSTDMPSTTATTEPSTTTGRVPSTVLMEEIPTPCTKNVVSTGIAAWIVISIALIVILVLCCVGLLVYIIHQKKKVILYLMKRIADLEAKQGQTMSTLSGKQPDN